jgi:hypothetical protein
MDRRSPPHPLRRRLEDWRETAKGEWRREKGERRIVLINLYYTRRADIKGQKFMRKTLTENILL